MEEQSLFAMFRKRLATYILVTFLVALLIIGFAELFIAFKAVNKDRVEKIENQLEDIRKRSKLEIFFSIFVNNYVISLNFLPPLAGTVFFISVIYSTSEIFASRALTIGNYSDYAYIIPFIYIFSLMFSPTVYFFGFLEFLGYSLTLSQSFFLISSTIKSIRNRDIRYIIKELKFTFIIVMASAITLLLAAYLESLLI